MTLTYHWIRTPSLFLEIKARFRKALTTLRNLYSSYAERLEVHSVELVAEVLGLVRGLVILLGALTTGSPVESMHLVI